MILVPDYDLYHAVTWALEYIRKDIESDIQEDKKFLYALINGIENTAHNIGNYEMYEQAKAVFARNRGEQRYLDCFLGYNMQRSMFPSIHLLIPTESSTNSGLGIGEGYLGEKYVSADTTMQRGIYTCRFVSTYQMLITSDNANEVILIYNILRAILIGLTDHFTNLGYLNASFSGQDIVIDGLAAPANVFHRSLNIHFNYSTNTPTLDYESLYEFRATINGKILPPESEKHECGCVQIEPTSKMFISHNEYLNSQSDE